ncbi:MAG: hypothetical protein N3G22_01000 [Candidatus Micrarchaeota archaeon]|nr:hypothetical protein [Candidatus Micrarchaeota archaeon]
MQSQKNPFVKSQDLLSKRLCDATLALCKAQVPREMQVSLARLLIESNASVEIKRVVEGPNFPKLSNHVQNALKEYLNNPSKFQKSPFSEGPFK